MILRGGLAARPLLLSRGRSSPREVTVKCKTVCPSCERSFLFDPEQVPVQRGRLRRKVAPVVAYYPACPFCHATAEVSVLSAPSEAKSAQK
jgi:hypothetical protein